MNKLIFIFALMSSVNVLAASKESYCTKDSRKVIYVTVDTTHTKTLARNQIASGELVVELPDGTAVLVPCGNYEIKNNNSPINSVIVDQSKVFLPKKNPKNPSVIGENYQTASVLVENSILLGALKNYFIQHSDAIEKQKQLDIQRRIDRR